MMTARAAAVLTWIYAAAFGLPAIPTRRVPTPGRIARGVVGLPRGADQRPVTGADTVTVVPTELT